MDSFSEPPSPEPLLDKGDNIKTLLDELEDSMDGDVGQIKRQYMSRIMPEDEEFNSSQVPIDTVSKKEVLDMIESIPKPMVQKPLQPGSSPADEDNRFLCWNNVGIIRAQNSAEDQGIDVMFHDTEKHSSVNFKNEPNYTFGYLAEDCIAVGTNGKYGTGPASIHGLNLLETCRENREWEVELPHVELIEALAAGHGFVAVATDRRNLRLFTNAGMQSYLFTLPGSILCMSAAGKQLMIIYHNGAGHSDDQNLSMYVYHIDLFNNVIKQTHSNVPVALSKRSPLSWAGFSDEGTPCTYDYSGMLRIYRQELGKTWVPLLDLRDLTSSALDHYFVVGVNEMAQSVKAVKCRRSRFPEFNSETAEMLAFSLPLCQMDTERGRLEEEHVRLRLAEFAYERAAKRNHCDDTNYSFVEAAIDSNEKLLVNNILRLFALCLKEDKEEMAKKLVYMIPKAHTSKLVEFAWKINRPQYFIDSLNKTIEEREQIDLNLIKATNGNLEAFDDDEDDVRSVTSSHHNFGKDLRRELSRQKQPEMSPNKLRPLPLDKLATNNINRLMESNNNNNNGGNGKRTIGEMTDDSGDENDVKRATKRNKNSALNYNLFSKKPRA